MCLCTLRRSALYCHGHSKFGSDLRQGGGGGGGQIRMVLSVMVIWFMGGEGGGGNAPLAHPLTMALVVCMMMAASL